MALVLANRVQETGTANTTVSFTLLGAVTGFQTFATVGNTNTTYYAATDATGNWEVGLGTYATSGPTLTRTTVYASSNSGSAVTFSGTCNIFLTYPSGRSVNLDASGNVSGLGTVSSGIWQATTVGVAYGGTGVTTSSGASSVMLRDANQNVSINRLNQSTTAVTAAGTTTTLTAASTFSQVLSGTGGQTFKLPDATTLTSTTTFEFNNNATGTLTLVDSASGAIGTVAPGGAAAIALLSNATVAGTWDVHAYIPENVQWGTNSLALGSTVITGGTWNGGTIASGYGGTGLTTFTAANNALYSTSSSALAAGTLPIAAGGTAQTSFTAGYVHFGSFSTSSNLFWDNTNFYLGIGTTSPTTQLEIKSPAFTDSQITLDNTSSNTTSRVLFKAAGTEYGRVSGDSTQVTLQAGNIPMVFRVNSAERMRIDSSGNVGIGTGASTPQSKLEVRQSSSGAIVNGLTLSNYLGSAAVGTGVALYLDPNGAGSNARAASIQSTQSTAGNYADLRFYVSNSTTPAEAVRILPNGYVGIGTTSPQNALVVSNAGAGGVEIDPTGYISSYNRSTSAQQDLYIRALQQYFYSNGVERMRISSAGLVGVGTSTTATSTLQSNGSTSTSAFKTPNIAEVNTVSATAATGTINYDVTTQSVLYYTSNASANWTVNFRGSSGTSLNTLMQTGESISVTFLVTQGSTAYYNSALTIDGTSVTPKWQGGTAPTSGNASSIDSYTFVIIKTASATYTVLAAQTKFA